MNSAANRSEVRKKNCTQSRRIFISIAVKNIINSNSNSNNIIIDKSEHIIEFQYKNSPTYLHFEKDKGWRAYSKVGNEFFLVDVDKENLEKISKNGQAYTDIKDHIEKFIDETNKNTGIDGIKNIIDNANNNVNVDIMNDAFNEENFNTTHPFNNDGIGTFSSDNYGTLIASKNTDGTWDLAKPGREKSEYSYYDKVSGRFVDASDAFKNKHKKLTNYIRKYIFKNDIKDDVRQGIDKGAQKVGSRIGGTILGGTGQKYGKKAGSYLADKFNTKFLPKAKN